ncbi:MAG: hypothetical protein GW938_00815 [Leptospira sp.]|nr:hypothetical protein [Leptospira sp.]
MNKKLISIVLMQFLTVSYLGSQEIPFYSLLTQMPWSSQVWETSYSIPRDDPQFLQAISVPFSFPMETALLYAYKDIAPISAGTTSDVSIAPYQMFRNQNYQGPQSVAFLYRKKNFGLNLGMTMQMASNEIGQKLLEMNTAKIRASYRLPSKWLGLKDADSRVELFLELSELNRYSYAHSYLWQRPLQSGLIKTGENANRTALSMKQIYANSGVSVSTSSNFIFEGQVKIPMNAREANRTLDELWTPEIQTNLGMKYLFPVH